MDLATSNSSLSFLGGIGFQELIVLSFVFLIPAAFCLTAIVLLAKNKQDSTTKIIWLVAILVFPFLGALLYLIVGRRQNRVA